MSQQGEKPTGHEDDWWRQLYDDSTEDTGPAAVADSLDDRFESASGTVGGGLDPGPESGSDTRRASEPAQPSEPRPPSDARPVSDSRSVPDSASVSDSAADLGRGSVRRSDAGGLDGPPRPERPPAVPGSSSPEPGKQPPPLPRQPPAVSGQRGGPSASAARPDATPHDESVSRPGRWERGPVPGPGADMGPPGRGGAPSEPPSWEPTPWEPTAWEPPSWELPPPAQASAPAQAVPAPFPPGPKPPGFTAQEPSPDASGDTRSDTYSEPPAARVPASRAPSGVPPKPVSAPAPPPGAAPPGPAAAVLPSTTGGFRTPPESAPEDMPAGEPRETVLSVVQPPPSVGHVGSGPPTYDPEPTALPPAEPDELADLVADTVLDGARYGTSTLRAVSVRGDSARYRGEPRRDALLTARFGTGEQALVLVAMATGARATPGAHRAAAEACRWIGQAVGRSHERLADDIRAARRGDLKSGLQRLTDRSLGKLRASAAEQGVEPEEYAAGLRCLLLPADPECRTRVFFGVGAGGLFRLRDGEWQDIEPRVADTIGEPVVGFGSPPHETPEGDRLTMDLGITTPPSPYEPAPRPPHAPFRFRASIARPGDTLLLCTGGLAEPLRGEPELAEYLTTRWSAGEPPGLAAFLADSLVRVKGYSDDRTAAAVWEA
ncbi:protein phosphatase 2C domain-containing protein [Streptomyces sp. NPDC005784]|uniref:PP2C family serine/threonine-protein phosphatase n=1 Tax=Streptomyces sp. NPDC005784 TaxID=3364731 RepID=UPI00368E22B5